ncbi:MAG: hypothetical protein ACJ8FY_21100 [Gemmataceae bacterium]
MRPTTFVFLAIVCIVIASMNRWHSDKLHVPGGASRSGSPASKASSKSSLIKVSNNGKETSTSSAEISFWTKPFYGRTEEIARQLALETAQRELIGQLVNRMPSLRWQPSVKYIDEHVKESLPTEDQVEVAGRQMQGVSLLVELTADDFREIEQMDRNTRRDERQIFLARMVATLVTICAAVAGYFRLDEATKGYYTNLLRLGSLAVIGAVGAGVWLLA